MVAPLPPGTLLQLMYVQERLRKLAAGRFVEVGPGNVLSGLLRRIDKTVKAIPVNSPAGLQKLEEELATT